MGGSPSNPASPTGLLANIQGAPIDKLDVDPNSVITYLISSKVPQQKATSISTDIARKSVNEIAGILDLIPGLEQVGGVIGIISGLFDLLSGNYQVSFNSILKGLMGQSFIIDHYSSIRANFKAISYNIGILKYDQACQIVLQNYYQVNERVQNGTLKSWYTSMSNKKSLQLLVLYYKANVQIVQIFDQVLAKLTPQSRLKYEKIMTDYLACLNQLKANIVDYRGSLMSIRVFVVPAQHQYWMQSDIEDKGQDLSQSYSAYMQKGDYTNQFNDFKAKSINQAQWDLNLIAII